jgi:DNA-binding SARP family transcriptional activator
LVAVIEIRVLGPLEAVVNGVRADLGGPRRRSVLARLAAERGRVVSADRLIEDMYAGEAPPRALAALQAHVSHLRRALEPGAATRRRPRRQPGPIGPIRAAGSDAQVLVTAPPGYALRVGQESVDAWRFESQVHDAAALDDPAAAHAVLSSALASWRGRAFAEFAGMPWADLEASRLDELRLTALEWQAESALRLGHAAQVVADLSRLVAEHPLREEAWRLLALALYQSGRQGDALAALERARSRLAEELGIEPGPALQMLQEDILAQAPRLSPSAARQPGPPASPAQAVTNADHIAATRPAGASGDLYLGRDAELAQVLGAAADSGAGRMRIVLVTGEAGAGKTALTAQVSRRLTAQGWTVAAGRCREDEGAPAAWPWAEALRQLAQRAAPADPDALGPLLADRPPADGDPAAARFALQRAVADYLGAASGAAPLLIVLDDLHRADSQTLALLVGVTADLVGRRVLVLATYRPTEAAAPLADCLAALAGREPVRVTLRGLDAEATAELIRVASSRAVDDVTAALIAERTGGNPFFVRETIRLLDSEGAAAATSEVPAGVAEVLTRRIARLPATAQTILAQAAVIGIESGIDVLADVSGNPEDVVLDAVEAGLVTGLVTEPSAGRIRFAHALVKDTLYGGLSRLRRSRLHARAAQAIEWHTPGDVAALAYHFAEAGSEPAAAARYSRLAAEQAEKRFAYYEAARLWEQAITCLDRAGTAGNRYRLELVLGLVRALAYTGQLTRARTWRHDAVAAALPLGDPGLVAEVITAFDVATLWPTHEYYMTDHELVGAVEQTLLQLPAGDRLLRSRLLATLAFELDGAKSDRGYHASAESLAMARRLGDPGAITVAANGRYFQSFRHDGLEDRFQLGRELLALPDGPVTTRALAHVMLMTAHSGQGGFGKADEHAAEAAQIADRYDLPVMATRARFYRAMRAALAGDASADELYHGAAAQMTRLGMWQHGVALQTLGTFSMHVTADRAADSADDLERMYADSPWKGFFSELYAVALAASGRIDDARAVAGRPAPVRRDVFWLFITGVRGVLAVAIDDRSRAESVYEALLPFAGRPAGADTAAITLWPAALILGDLARYLGRPGAHGQYQRALAVAEAAGVRSWVQAATSRLTGSTPGRGS